jgi:hypothetical protein
MALRIITGKAELYFKAFARGTPPQPVLGLISPVR